MTVTSVPSATWRMLAHGPCSARLPKGMDALWHKTSGLAANLAHAPKRLLRQAERILDLEKQYRHVSDRGLRDTALALQERFRLGRETPRDRSHAFALVREVADRKIGLRAYEVQVAGALAIEAGGVAEMATGEGKTLVATMPAVLAGWRGQGCHVVTVNEYLAQRDADWMGPVYRFFGLEAACIRHDMTPAHRRQAYNGPITYCTNKEAAADFLRDRIAIGRHRGLPSVLLEKLSGTTVSPVDRVVQRGLACAIVDEADSVFIDEAVTPLILSGENPNPGLVDAYTQASDLADELAEPEDYRTHTRYGEVTLTGEGKQRLAEKAEPMGGLWGCTRRREELVVQALAARAFYTKGKQYVLDDGKVVIVDEFTGRLMPDRSWRSGLHQAVEAKEGLDVQMPKETIARISFQRFFRLYRKLSGMTGTAAEARGELWQIYRLPVVPVPTHHPTRRVMAPDRVFASAASKWEAVVDAASRMHRSGRPILIGTRSVRDSEHLSRRLTEAGLDHQVLNACRESEEAQIIAGAGKQGRITVATNMAGRGTDIRLGAGVAALGGLHVIATERHEAGRIDRQLFGRCARQGDPGSAQAFVSLEDELVRRHAPGRGAAVKRCSWAGEISSVFTRRLIHAAQQSAQRAAVRHRRTVLRTDDWMDENLGFAGKEV